MLLELISRHSNYTPCSCPTSTLHEGNAAMVFRGYFI